MNIVEQIKKDNRPSLKDLFLSSYLISQRVSPYVSSFYIKRKIIPNKITLHMIFSGIIGGVLFSMPNVYLKALGVIFVQLWFILDCSDGEVARYTKTFSKYGKELDFVAHLINHPLFGTAMLLSLIQLGRYNTYYLVFLVFFSNFVDYLNRNILTLNIVIDLKSQKASGTNRANKWTIRKVFSLIISIFILYPNLVLFGVIIYFIDYFCGTNILYWYLIGNVGLTTLFAIRDIIQITKIFYSSK